MAANKSTSIKPKYAVVDLNADEDGDDEDEVKLPPAGAPAWLATFADIATNLMAFFVLILGFAKFDEVSFKKMAGSMRETFGTEVVSPVLEYMEGGTVIEMDFLPQGMPPDPDKGEEPPRGDDGQWQDRSGPDDKRSNAPDGEDEEQRTGAQEAAKELMSALAEGNVKIEQGDRQVTIRLPEDGGPTAENVAEALASLTGKDVAQDNAATGSGDAPDGEKLSDDVSTNPPSPGSSSAPRGTSPGFAAAKLSVSMREEIAQGLVEVERRNGEVIVTVGAGGAFASGSADLTAEAQALLEKITREALTGDATVEVTGHTDDRPLGNSPFVDNLGLGAARAAAVARELSESGKVAAGKIVAQSMGETQPVADNTTEEGRAKNRRVEIVINYGSGTDPASP